MNNSQCPFHITCFSIFCFSSTCHHIVSRLSLLSFPVPLHLIGSFCPWHRSESSNLCFSELLFCECRLKIDCLTFLRMFSTGIQNIPSFISTTSCSNVSRVCCLINTLQPTAQHHYKYSPASLLSLSLCHTASLTAMSKGFHCK